ncbi:thioesterase family protein [Stakelama tenebrarum]|uniref:Thioesterase family protein n=1 Tax=Stakelama tenebrarum TaxID=2711215 RepID=A0A6G6Y7Z9_9SPHN|nr:thioesterase family protein [Sphingosinithalassobacter tenebrarum]QIG80971.1 thioesterase family protein [Sphingosinithalassobacter tenebrarum]
MTDETPSLPKLIASLPQSETPRIPVPEGWHQGRTAYGGLSTALALAAVQARWPDLPPLRSAQVAFIGPVAGSAEIRTELLRRGRSAAYIQADVVADGGLGVRITFVFMSARESHVDAPAAGIAPDALPPRSHPLEITRHIPAFIGNFELFSTGEEENGRGHISRWARLRDRDGLDPMVEIAAIGDVLPPAAMRLFTQFGPISSMNWQINLLTEAPQTEDGWWLVRSTVDHARAGASGQHMSIHNSRGEAIATATQFVALFV